MLSDGDSQNGIAINVCAKTFFKFRPVISKEGDSDPSDI